jgi:hypothetical protein
MELTMAGLNDNQRRYLLSTLRHVDDLLWKAEHILAKAGEASPLNQYQDDFTPEQREEIQEFIGRVREAMLRILEDHDIHDDHSPISGNHAVNALFLLASVAVEELRPKHLRGYGQIADEAVQDIHRIVDGLQGLMARVR